MKPSEFKICISIESYDGTTAEHYRNFYCRKVQIEVFNEGCVKMSRLYLLYLSRNKLSKTVAVKLGRVGLGRYWSGYEFFNINIRVKKFRRLVELINFLHFFDVELYSCAMLYFCVFFNGKVALLIYLMVFLNT